MHHHGAGLRVLLKKDGLPQAEQDELLAALRESPEDAPVGRADRAMLRYALKLTTTPGAIVSEDVEALRDAGYDDHGIHDICSVVAYFNFVNRIASGLGVELEPSFSDGAA